MNIIESLTARIEDGLKETKKPCKSYKTEAAANKALAAYAEQAGKYFDQTGRPCRYVVFYMPQMQRWVGALDYSELLNRSTSTGGYLGFIKGIYCY